LHRCVRRAPRRAARVAPRPFGGSIPGEQEPVRAFTLSDDLRLFATTFVAGFLFVSIVIA